MRAQIRTGRAGIAALLAFSACAQEPGASVPVHLTVSAGTPIPVYLTKRVGYRDNAPVTAKVVEPIWSFDRVTIPAGSTVQGKIVTLRPVPKFVRTMSMVRGDFTPLKHAEVEFTRVTLPDGRSLQIQSQPSVSLGSFYYEPKPKKPKKPKRPVQTTQTAENSRFRNVRSMARQQAESALSSRSRGLFGVVRAPDRKEWLENFLWTKLPYHPQWYPRGSRFDALLDQPLDFGTVQIPQAELRAPSMQPSREQSASLRMATTISSADAKPGDPIRGTLTEPLFTPAHQLILPQGSAFTGKVTLAKPARYFHRGGKLRFTFNQIETPPDMPELGKKTTRTQAQVDAVEQHDSKVSVDEEGTAKATESNTRFLRPVVAGLVAAKSMDNDEGKAQASGDANYSGRAAGGFSGFGLFGTLIVKAPKPLGSALGFYGLAWSVYSTVVSRGRDVTFPKNSAVSIRFGARE